MGNKNDRDLLSLLNNSNEAAFTEIFNKFWPKLYEKAYRILRDESAAQDAVQEVFISLWERRGDFRINNLEAYLAQATRFGVLKAIRAQRTDAHFYERLQQVTTELITQNPLLFKEQQDRIGELLDTLPEDCKETFRLSREEDLSYKEIAERLNISVKTVEKRVSKALKHFRTGLIIDLCLLCAVCWLLD